MIKAVRLLFNGYSKVKITKIPVGMEVSFYFSTKRLRFIDSMIQST